MRRYLPDLCIALLLVAATAAVYGQVAGHEFVNFDDQDYAADNPHVRAGLSWANLAWAFRTTTAANWHPLTWLSLLLDSQLFGPGPRGFHLTNVGLHAANAVLLFLVLRAMTGARWRSGLVAALFALHPLHVESVAWVAERKDVLSTLFWMLTLAAYAWYAARPGLLRYGLVVLAFVLGLMAKPMLVTLPCVLLLLDFWPLRRMQAGGWKLAALDKLPLFALSAASCMVTVSAQQQGGAMKPLARFGLDVRAANAVAAYGDYVVKTFWPRDLAVFYPHPGERLPWWHVAAAAVLLLAVSALVVWLARRRPYLAVGWLWFLGTLVPVLGLVQVGGQALADRYTYVPLVGLFVMLAWGVPDLLTRWRRAEVVLVPSAVVLLLACMAGTYQQVATWRNSVTLWEQALKAAPENSVARTNLGLALMGQGRLEEAIDCLRKAVKLRDDGVGILVAAHVNLGMALARQGDVEEAIDHYTEALRLQPGSPIAHNNLGVLLERQDRAGEALEHYREAVRLDPGYANAHNNLGAALVKQGQLEDAAEHFRAAVRHGPALARFRYNLASTLQELGRSEEADAEFRAAARLDPHRPQAAQKERIQP